MVCVGKFQQQFEEEVSRLEKEAQSLPKCKGISYRVLKLRRSWSTWKTSHLKDDDFFIHSST